MPGLIYFYINFWSIQLNKSSTSKQKVVGSPSLRDLEWDKGYVFTEARGFSGFEGDDVYTCNRILENSKDLEFIKERYPKTNEAYQEMYDSKGELKKFEPARTYLRRNHNINLGKPIYKNAARNVVDCEARGSGKSFFATVMIAHNFLFDGALDYDDFLLQQNSKAPYTSETMIAAIDSKYSNDLISKFKIGLDNLKGNQEKGNTFYPSPLSKKYDGSLMCGKFITAKYKVKRGSNWDTKGSMSKIYHRSVADSHEACNGTRSNITLLEEVGFMGNLEEVLGSLKDTTYNGMNKTGTIWMFGTGGAMESGKTEALKKVFYDPEAYDCLSFEDTWENTGKIGYFVPYHYAVNDFKDSEGRTDLEKAERDINTKRDDLKKRKSKEPYKEEQQNNPIKPSEAFMVTDGNIFPTTELKEHLNYLESLNDPAIDGVKGTITFDSFGKTKWTPDLDNELRAADYPVKKGEAMEGCIVIWEDPVYINGEIPYGLYIAGCLPPGEKVLTDKGLKNIELVDKDDNLYDITGKETEIKEFTKYYVEDYDLYKFKVSNTYRTTTFTDEHPIFASIPKKKYISSIKAKRLGIRQDYKEFDFQFVESKNITLDHWVKVPNLYRNPNTINISSFWNNDCRVDRIIDNPLGNKDFWWFMGLFLGDGWTESNGHKISIAFNITDKKALSRAESIIKELFKRKYYKRTRENCTYIEFSMLELKVFIDLHFKKYALGKVIPEWVKRLPVDLKKEFISGYLSSDGCVTKGRYYTTEFVSINLELLEGIQDMLFSIGIISGLNRMRKTKKAFIRGKEINQKETYHLRLNNYDTLALLKLIPDNEKLTIIPKEYVDTNTSKRYNKQCFFEEGLDYYYLQITGIEKVKYDGYVYNFHTNDNTYMCHHLPTHNTDPYDQDEAANSMSLGSTFIYKTFMTEEGVYDWIVAEYTGRPGTAKEHHENVRKLLLHYNARDLYENEKNTIKMHFEQKNSLHLLATTPTILKSTQNSSVNRGYGIHMTDHIKDELEVYTRDWLTTEIGNGKLRLHNIYSKPLLKELIAYSRKKGLNFDRVISFMLCILHKEQTHRMKIQDLTKEPVRDPFFDNLYKIVKMRNSI